MIYFSKPNFSSALKEYSLEKIKLCPKADLHNHAGRGGTRKYLETELKVKLGSPKGQFSSNAEMEIWFKSNINSYLPQGLAGYIKRVEASFVAAQEDNIKILALDFGFGEIEVFGGIENFSTIINLIHLRFAPEIKLLPVLAIYDEVDVAILNEYVQYHWFSAIDIINNYKKISMGTMKQIAKIAKNNAIKIKAHVGEFGTALEVYIYANELNLDEIQHGIMAYTSPFVLRWLADSRITLNLCPTSNCMLGVIKDFSQYPIKKFIDFDVNITINTDDLLIFNSSVSNEYLKLYKANLLSVEELCKVCAFSLMN